MEKWNLEGRIANFNLWMERANIAVAVGILGEIFTPIIFDKEILHKKRELCFSVLFGLLVLLGVVGEWQFGAKLSHTASEMQRTADLEAAELHKQAAEAQRVAANARSEASYFERDIAIAKQRAAEANTRAASAEAHLAEAKASAANALEAAEVARKNAESFRLEIAKAHDRAAQAGKEAARLNKLAEEEKLARLKIEARLADRQLTDKQIAIIASKLRSFAGQEFQLTTYSQLTETKAFADRIQSALSRAGWKFIAPDPSASLLAGTAGVNLYVHPEASELTQKAAKAFVAALTEHGVDATLMPPDLTLSGTPTNKIDVCVGTKK